MDDTITLPNTLEDDAEDFGGHPLFPRSTNETGTDPRKFDLIQIHRYLPDGSKEVCPKAWKGSELRSWQQIVDEYGGECTYQLAAQCGKTHRFTAWSERAYFASPPRKPFTGGTGSPQRQETSNAQTITGAMPNHPFSMYPQTMPYEIFMQMHMSMLKMLTERRDGPNTLETVREVAAIMNGGNRGPNSLELVRELMPMINNGERSTRSLMQGIELARDLYANNTASPAPAKSGTEEIGDVLNIVKLFMPRPSAQPAPAPTPAPAPAPAPLPAPIPQQPQELTPPCNPPPGYGWIITQKGWELIPVVMPTNLPIINNPSAPIPPPAPTASPAPAPAPPAPAPTQTPDAQAWLQAFAAHPQMRAMLDNTQMANSISNANAAFAPTSTPNSTPPAPAAMPTPAPAMPGPLATSSGIANSSTNTPTIDVPAPNPHPSHDYTLPQDFPMSDELREMFMDPGFREIASAVVPQEAQHVFQQLVSQNALKLDTAAPGQQNDKRYKGN